jgi:hypothetical protein
MKIRPYSFLIMASLAVFPTASRGQGIVGGAQQGAHDGNKAAGPVGAIIGGAVGAVGGGIAGLLGADQRPRFHEYVVREHQPSYVYSTGPVEVGATLPEEGVTYYDVPPEYGVREYRYTNVNGRTVLVDPRTHRIVEILD